MNQHELKRAQRLLRACKAGQDPDYGDMTSFRVDVTENGIVFNPKSVPREWAGATASEALDKGEAWLRASVAHQVSSFRELLDAATKRAEAAVNILSERLDP